MNYSAASMANVSLQRIGARGSITSLTENSPNAVKVNTVWNFVLSEVLSERDWKVAKTRVQLQQSAIKPTYGYCYAYALPADFLRLCKPREIPEERRIANADYYGSSLGGDWGGSHERDVPVWPRCVAPYITETVADTSAPPNYTTCLLTDYSASECPVAINYIRLLTDLTQLTPGLANCIISRLSAELAIAITEDKKKAQGMMELYRQQLASSQAQLECDDYLKDEAGSQSWVEAGRWCGWRR